MTVLALPTGCKVEVPEDRLLRFFAEEYAYYDGIPSADPDHVTPCLLYTSDAADE